MTLMLQGFTLLLSVVLVKTCSHMIDKDWNEAILYESPKQASLLLKLIFTAHHVSQMPTRRLQEERYSGNASNQLQYGTTKKNTMQPLQHLLPYRSRLKKLVTNIPFNFSDIVPTLIPNQGGPLPSLQHDVFCNEALMPNGCSSISDWGKAFGIPVRYYITNTRIAKRMQQIGGTKQILHNKAVQSLTPEIRERIQELSQITRLERFAKNITDVFFENSLVSNAETIATNLTSLLRNAIMSLDPTSPEDTLKWILNNQQKAAVLCRLSGNRFPNCRQKSLQSAEQNESPMLTTEGINHLGFYEYILVRGVSDGCYRYGSCSAGDITLQPSVFDGVYSFDGINSNTGFPTYKKLLAKNRQLFFWIGLYDGLNTKLLLEEGLSAGITLNDETFNSAMFGQRFFALIRKGLKFPIDCKNIYNFPVCLSGDSRWRILRFSRGHCTGKVYKNIACYWDIGELTIEGIGMTTQHIL